MKIKDLLTSKCVLYIILIIAIMHVVGYIAIDNERALVFFLSVGVLTTFFSRNMIVVLLVSILSTNLLFAGQAIHEGLTNKDEDEDEEDEEKEKKAMYANAEEEFTQKNIPSSVPAPATEEEEDEAIGKRIDYASTLEQAYDNLQQMLGPDGINGLSKETKNLVYQQKSLMKNLNDMAPVLKTAKETLDTMSGSMPNLQNIQSLMKNFGGGFLGKGGAKNGIPKKKK